MAGSQDIGLMASPDGADSCLLTYCSNIHPGESWPEHFDNLRRYVPAVKQAVSSDTPLGLGLRLSAQACETLGNRSTREALSVFLEREDLFVFTINGFPYGPFHGQPVKDQVYQPDWRHEERLTYTNRLADLLSYLLPDGLTGSISTVPGTYKPLGSGAEECISSLIIQQVAHNVRLREEKGANIVLALEPEPYCFLETIAETVDFFNNWLFSGRSIDRLVQITGLSRGRAEDALRRHLGVCYDVCHAAVEFEDPAESIAALRSSEIPIHKLQLSSALRLPRVDERSLEALRAFDEPTYLHQVVARANGSLIRYADLPDALALGACSNGQEWRIHFHVPIFLANLEAFSTTQSFLQEILDLHRQQPISRHLEVETYTWDVLPEQLRDVTVDQAIAREIRWVQDRLGR